MSKRSGRRRSFIVTLTLPPRASESRARGYILDAVASWHGSLEPDNEQNHFNGDPMFYLDGDSVKVKQVGKSPIPGVVK